MNKSDPTKYFFVRGFSNDVNYVHPNPKRIGIVDEKGGKEAGVRYRAALQGVVVGTVTAPGTRPGAKEPVDKLYAIIKFEPWDWIIGFGDYVDDIENAFWRNTAILMSIAGVLMLVIALMAWQMLQHAGAPAGRGAAVRRRCGQTNCRRQPGGGGAHPAG